MKKSIFIAFSILLIVVGWIGSGQFTNVNAQDDTSTIKESNTETVEKVVYYTSSERTCRKFC